MAVETIAVTTGMIAMMIVLLAEIITMIGRGGGRDYDDRRGGGGGRDYDRRDRGGGGYDGMFVLQTACRATTAPDLPCNASERSYGAPPPNQDRRA